MTPNPLDYGACAACTDRTAVVWHAHPSDCPKRRSSRRPAQSPAHAARTIHKVPTPAEPSTLTLAEVARRDAGIGTPAWQAWAARRAG